MEWVYLAVGVIVSILGLALAWWLLTASRKTLPPPYLPAAGLSVWEWDGTQWNLLLDTTNPGYQRLSPEPYYVATYVAQIVVVPSKAS